MARSHQRFRDQRPPERTARSLRRKDRAAVDRFAEHRQAIDDLAKTPDPIRGTVRSSLELRGTFGRSDLKTVVKLREVKWVELTPAS